MVADILSQPNQVIGSEWTLHGQMFRDFQKRWPVMVDLFTNFSRLLETIRTTAR